MSVADVQGRLWGAEVHDYSTLVEGFFRPVYECVLEEAGVGPKSRLLDVACGPGLATRLAAQRGAIVAGLDAAEASIAIARERVPEGDFRVGDMESLPWPDADFDVVTSFNGLQFAADLTNALREVRRVARAGGHVAVVVWGPEDACDTLRVMAAVRELLPPQSSNARASVPLSAPRHIEELLANAGLTPETAGDVDCPFELRDLGTALRGLMSAGAAVAVVQRVGAEPVRTAIAEAIADFQTKAGTYCLRNRLRYVITSA